MIRSIKLFVTDETLEGFLISMNIFMTIKKITTVSRV